MINNEFCLLFICNMDKVLILKISLAICFVYGPELYGLWYTEIGNFDIFVINWLFDVKFENLEEDVMNLAYQRTH